MCVLEHQGQWSDVLLVHALAASDLYGMFDAFVDLFGGGLPYVGQRAVCKGGQDLQLQGGVRLIKAHTRTQRFPFSSYPCTYTVHVDGVPERDLRVPRSICFQDSGGLGVVNLVPFLLGADEESVDVVSPQKLAPVTAMTGLCLVGALETVQSRPRDVDASW